jgi:hypothetical protein
VKLQESTEEREETGVDEFAAEQSAEPLLLQALIAECSNGRPVQGTVSHIMRGLLESPVTDAERAGERLRVFGWEREQRPGTLVWEYRVIGEETGQEHARFSLAVRGAGSDLPLAVLGLQLQIALNGIDSTPAEELDCYLELAQASMASG